MPFRGYAKAREYTMRHFSPKRKKTNQPLTQEAFAAPAPDASFAYQVGEIATYARRLFTTAALGLLFALSTLYIGADWVQEDYQEQAGIRRLQDLSARLLTHALFLRNEEKDFISSQKTASVDAFRDHGAAALRLLDDMKMSVGSETVRSSLDRMTGRIHEHLQSFELLVRDYRTIGLTENEGLRGEMRKAAQIVEGYLHEDGLSPFMQVFLMVRRYEKDFFLSLEERHLVEVARGTDELANLIKAAPFKISTQETIYRLIEQYRDAFNTLAQKTLRARDQRAEIDRVYEDFSIVLGQVNDYVNGLLDAYHKRAAQGIFQFKAALTILGLMLLVFSGIYAILLLRRVTQALEQK